MDLKEKWPDKIAPSENFKRTERKRRLKFSKSKLPTLFLLIIAGYLFISVGAQVNKIIHLYHEADSLEQQIEALKTDNKLFQSKIEVFQTNAYVEKKARENLGLIKPGEKVIIPYEHGENMLEEPKFLENDYND